MKKLIVVATGLIFGAMALSACGDPCKKTMDKLEKCGPKDETSKLSAEDKKFMKEMSKAVVEACKKNKKAKKTFKDCLKKHDDCKKFEKCVSKVKLKDL